MSLFPIVDGRARFDASGNVDSDRYSAGIRFTQEGAARSQTSAGTDFNQGIPMSPTGQVSLVDATAGLPADVVWLSGLPISGNRVCISNKPVSVVSSGIPYDSAGAVAATVAPITTLPTLDLVFAGTATDPLDAATTTDDTLELNFVAQAYQIAAQYAVWGTGGLQQVNFADIVTFTRASTGTYFNSAGTLTSAAINEARFDYDPSTLALRGLLIEEQRTNLLLNSDSLSTQNVTVSATAYTLSFYGTGTVTLSGVSTAGPLVGSGAFPTRSTLTFTPTAGVLTLTVTGTVEFAQLEAGSFATSYIPTTTTALTRSADAASVNTLSPWYSQSAGTVYAEFASIADGSATQSPQSSGVWGINESAVAQFNGYGTSINLSLSNASKLGGNSRYQPTGKNSILAFGSTTGFIAANTTYKTAFAWDASDIVADSSIAGLASTANTAAVDMGTHNRMMLGNQLVGGSGPYQLNGWMRRITYYPRRLSNADLQTITT